jgi:tetratricopeptide (TPR) repeat protein
MHWRIDRDGGRSHHLIVACLLFLLLSTICLGSTDRDIEVPAADNVKQLLKQAKKLYRKGQLVQAEAIYRKILDSDSGNVTVKLDLAYLLLKQRRIRDSFDIAFAVAKADQQNARAFAILGATFLTAGNFPEARVCFLKSLSISKKEDVAWAGFGMLAFYENRIDEGIENLREATFREPDEPDYHFALGQVSARAERYKEAADSYRRFLSVASDLDSDRKTRIRGLISFLTYLGQKSSLYTTAGADGTTVPVKLIGNRPVIQLTINGEREPLNFVLDTGSGISVISEKTARRIGVRAITKGGFA